MSQLLKHIEKKPPNIKINYKMFEKSAIAIVQEY